jgi:hypothetical protein
VRIGWGRDFGESTVRVGDPVLPTQEFEALTYFGQFRYDTVDNVNFPRSGSTFSIGWRAEREGKGVLADANADLACVRPAVCPLLGTQYRHSLGFGMDCGPITTSTWCATSSRSAGFLNLSGIAPDALAAAELRHSARHLLPPDRRSGHRVPECSGVTSARRVEEGNIWADRRDISFKKRAHQWQRIPRPGIRSWALSI